ncbi:MAG: hypothetical protein U0575_01200 [Phycisphaerales bacterium]
MTDLSASTGPNTPADIDLNVSRRSFAAGRRGRGRRDARRERR